MLEVFIMVGQGGNSLPLQLVTLLLLLNYPLQELFGDKQTLMELGILVAQCQVLQVLQ